MKPERQTLKAGTEAETMELLTDLFFSDLFYSCLLPYLSCKAQTHLPRVTLLTVGSPPPFNQQSR